MHLPLKSTHTMVVVKYSKKNNNNFFLPPMSFPQYLSLTSMENIMRSRKDVKDIF